MRAVAGLPPALVALLAAASCGGAERSGPPPPPPVAETPAATAPAAPFAAVLLVAGSDEQAVFDNGRRALADAVRRKVPLQARIAQLSARRDLQPGEGVAPATRAGIEAALAGIAPGASACLVFATSHGTPRGLVLTYKDELLTPAFLDRLLARHCSGRPSVAIMSGCFSGVFADPPVPAPDRVVLTAAARDRTSFGCGDDFTYTYYDEALLEALPGAGTWAGLQAEVAAAIARRERALGEEPSLPQAVLGASVPAGLLLGGGP